VPTWHARKVEAWQGNSRGAVTAEAPPRTVMRPGGAVMRPAAVAPLVRCAAVLVPAAVVHVGTGAAPDVADPAPARVTGGTR
jgi:hypothetical protein